MRIFLSVVACCLFFSSASAQNEHAQPEKTREEQPAPLSEDLEWVWGEVVSVNSAEKSVDLKYIDYETDSEKRVVLTVNEKTKLENIPSFEYIKTGQTLSIDYYVSDGKNEASVVSLEQVDEIPDIEEFETDTVGRNEASERKTADMAEASLQGETLEFTIEPEAQVPGIKE